MKKIFLGFTEHLEYLFSLSRKARERHPDYVSLKRILEREGHWRRCYKMSSRGKDIVKSNLKGRHSAEIRTTPDQDDLPSMYDD